MKIIGLIGGIAAGKSTVSEMLHKRGAGIICADRSLHEVLELPEIMDQMRMRWGSAVIPDGICRIIPEDRKRIADIVFKDHKELYFLEEITEPIVIQRMLESIHRYHPKYTKVIVLDVPLLLEMGWDKKFCHFVWFVDTPEDMRLANYLRRNPLVTAQDFQIREHRQVPIADKMKRATHIIPNAGWGGTEARVEEALQDVLSQPYRPL